MRWRHHRRRPTGSPKVREQVQRPAPPLPKRRLGRERLPDKVVLGAVIVVIFGRGPRLLRRSPPPQSSVGAGALVTIPLASPRLAASLTTATRLPPPHFDDPRSRVLRVLHHQEPKRHKRTPHRHQAQPIPDRQVRARVLPHQHAHVERRADEKHGPARPGRRAQGAPRTPRGRPYRRNNECAEEVERKHGLARVVRDAVCGERGDSRGGAAVEHEKGGRCGSHCEG
jgi:hypothetical protein